MSSDEKRKTKFDALTKDEINRFRKEWVAFGQSTSERHTSEAIELVERGWAAGFFDGEGHASARTPDDVLTGGPTITVEIDQGYGDLGRENLLRFQRAVRGVGALKERATGEHRWRATSEEDVETVWAAIGPFLGLAKFIQLREVLQVAAVRSLRTESLETFTKERPNVRTVDVLPRSDKNQVQKD